jgi:hypothetical protein
VLENQGQWHVDVYNACGALSGGQAPLPFAVPPQFQVSDHYIAGSEDGGQVPHREHDKKEPIDDASGAGDRVVPEPNGGNRDVDEPRRLRL